MEGSRGEEREAQWNREAPRCALAVLLTKPQKSQLTSVARDVQFQDSSSIFTAWVDSGVWIDKEPSLRLIPMLSRTLSRSRGDRYFGCWRGTKLLGAFSFRLRTGGVSNIMLRSHDHHMTSMQKGDMVT